MTSLSKSSFLHRFFGFADQPISLTDSHAFLQERVTLYLRVELIFFSVFLAIGILKALVLFPSSMRQWVDETWIGNLLIAILTAMIAAGYFYLKRSMRPHIVLHLFESAGTVVGCAILSNMVRLIPANVMLGVTMFIALVLTIRAALIPSDAMKTLVVGILSSIVLTIPIWKAGRKIDPEVDFVGHHLWIAAFFWGIIFSISTAIISRVIYGLQRKVQQAMQLGNYTLQEKIGEGGMGSVYLAHHALLTRPTVVKLLPPEKAGAHNVARFEREVQQTSRLSHPNTVQIYDYGHTPDGIFYYAMEYLDGLNLEELISLKGPQPEGRIIYVIAQVAHALAEAHSCGLIHRDIKPANIVLCNRGGQADMSKVLDFGLIKDIKAPTELRLSRTDAITGTPRYMAPEGLTEPDKVDGRTDIYALGAVGYFMLTGTHVFDGLSMVEVCSHHLHTEPEAPSKRLDRAVSSDLERALLRCLEKDPKDRFQAVMDLRDALLKCESMAQWGLDEASHWWSENAEQVQQFCHRKRQRMSLLKDAKEAHVLRKSVVAH